MHFLLRHDTLAKWESNNPVLMNAEIVVVEEDGFRSLAIGDGEHRFAELPRVKLQKGSSVMTGLYQSGRARLHIVKDETMIKEEENKPMNKNYIVINGKKAELTEEQLKALGIVTKKNPFERVAKSEPYYYIDAFDCIQTCADNGEDVDNASFEVSNYFNDKATAQQVRLHQLLYRKLLKFAYDNECEDNQAWNKVNCHYYIGYNINEDQFYADVTAAFKHNDVWFCSRDSAKHAIEEVVEPFMKEHPDFVW
jgi:hypothetical protein